MHDVKVTVDCDGNPLPSQPLVPYWTACTVAQNCNTCGGDIWIGDRCVISGPTMHCQYCGPFVAHHEDDGEVR